MADRDVTNAFAFSQQLQFADDDDVGGNGSPRALRRLRYVTERRHNALRLTVDDDGRRIDCVATVAGLTANKTSVHIIVHCKRIFYESNSVNFHPVFFAYRLNLYGVRFVINAKKWRYNKCPNLYLLPLSNRFAKFQWSHPLQGR